MAEEFNVRPSADIMGRLSSCLVEQARYKCIIIELAYSFLSFYPVLPAAPGANLDYSRLEDLEWTLTPDIIISPSDLGSFAKSVDSGSSVCINPGRACRKNALGGVALLTINPPELSEYKSDLISSRLRVDFINL